MMSLVFGLSFRRWECKKVEPFCTNCYVEGGEWSPKLIIGNRSSSVSWNTTAQRLKELAYRRLCAN